MSFYQVTFNSLVMSMVTYGLILWGSWGISSNAVWNFRKIDTTRRRRLGYAAKAAGIFMTALITGIVALNIVTFSGAHLYNNQMTPMTAQETATSFGLESGKSYPLVLGDRVEGASGTADLSASHGFFTARADASVTLTPGSSLSVSFQHQDKSYVLEIPVARSTFVQREGISPTVTLHLNPVTNGYGHRVTEASPSCAAIIKTALLMCHRHIIEVPRVNETTTRRGLAALISDQSVLDSATFEVTPAMYSQIMGKDE